VTRLYAADMTSFPRYAIYYAAAAAATSRASARNAGLRRPQRRGLAVRGRRPAVVAGLARPDADPRKYGFHATLKAPLTLAPGLTEAELLAACATFAATPRPIPVIQPVVDSISGFIAVVPPNARPN